MSDGTQTVVEAVIGYIDQHRLRSGDALPSEKAFADKVGVSRTVVRQAFGALGALRLIETSNGRRPRVGRIDGSVVSIPMAHAVSTAQATVQQVWDARRALERRTAELAAMQRTPAEAERICELARLMRAAGADLPQQVEHDIAFHGAIAEATHNPVLTLLIGSFAHLMRVTCPIGWQARRTDADRTAVFDQHDCIAAAIQKGDPAGAEAAMDAHFELSLRALVGSGFN
jgi:GntR family transcriptional repressor for pyruvate dehydrogenase complex